MWERPNDLVEAYTASELRDERVEAGVLMLSGHDELVPQDKQDKVWIDFALLHDEPTGDVDNLLSPMTFPRDRRGPDDGTEGSRGNGRGSRRHFDESQRMTARGSGE
jgi:hypothetical protein